MAWIACDDTEWAYKKYGGPLFLIQNSWGEFNGGPKRNDQPDGSFWIRPAVAKSMLSDGGGWVIASVRGFERELVLDRSHTIQEMSNA
jgi:C1A family cysteine protease